jgi:hypothetical protein
MALAPDQVTEFMWMFRVHLADDTSAEAYKHSRTRRYLYLDTSGRAFIPVGAVTYEESDPVLRLADVTAARLVIVGQNDWVSGNKVSWARSATRHRIPRAQTLFAIRGAGICFEDGKGRANERRLYFFADDEDGRALEVVGFAGEDEGLFVVHSMPLRKRYEARYQEALRWRKS